MADWSGRYEYKQSNVEKYVPNSGGVYRLIHKDGDKFYVFYVGQSEELERRLLEHLGPNEPNACIRRHVRDYSCYFRFVEVSSSSGRDRTEREEIKKYKPSCNG